jgi:uncharacterized protein
VPTPDRRPRGHNRRAQLRRQDESQGSLLQRISAATLPLRQRLGQGMSGLGQRNKKEAKTGSFKLASPLPRKNTIGLLILVPIWLLLLVWEPAPSAPGVAPSGSLAVPLAVPALTVGSAATGGAVQAAKPVEEEKVDGSWLQHDVQAGETLYSIFRKFELPGAELSRLIAIEGPDRPLTRLQSGKSVFILVDSSRRIQRVEIRSFGQANYRYDRQGEGFALKE